MSVEAAQDRLEWLRAEGERGALHTVRVAWFDRLGAWRGKRLPLDTFLGSPERRISFCDGMIVVDVNCDVIQTTPFSNFDTGYPDMYLRPDPGTLRPVGWLPGEAYVLGRLENHGGDPLAVAPTNVIRSVEERLAGTGLALRATVTLNGRLFGGRDRASAAGNVPDGLAFLREVADGLAASELSVRSVACAPGGAFRMSLAPNTLAAAASAASIAKAALKESAALAGLQAVFMTCLPGATRPAQLEFDLDLEGAAMPAEEALESLLAEARGLLQPSVNALKAGPIRIEGRSDRAGTFRAAAEADPATSLAVFGAAIGAASNGGEVDRREPRGLVEAADFLARSGWAREWLGGALIENAVPLLVHEASAFGAAVTDWELDRYWSAG